MRQPFQSISTELGTQTLLKSTAEFKFDKSSHQGKRHYGTKLGRPTIYKMTGPLIVILPEERWLAHSTIS